MSLWVPLPVDVYEHPRMLSAMDDREGGDAALALYCAGLAYAKKHTIIPAGALRLLTRSRRPQRVAACLVRHGLWTAIEGGYMPAELTGLTVLPSSPPGAIEAEGDAPRAPMTDAERARLYRQRKSVTRHVTEPVTDRHEEHHDAVTESVTDRHEPSRPLSALSPSERAEKEQSKAEQTPEMRASSVTRHVTEPVTDRHEEHHSSRDDEVAAALTEVVKSLASRPSRSALERAYAEGARSQLGTWAFPHKPWEHAAVDDAIAAHGAGRQGDELAAWVRSSVTAYVAAMREVRVHITKGFAPTSWLDWLNAGSPPAPTSRRSGVAVQPAAPDEVDDWASKAIRP